jgi:hypothetical protein
VATVATTALTDPLGPPPSAAFARDSTNGRLYVLARTSAVDTLTLYRSTDSGGSWGVYASFTHTGLQEWSSLVVDKNGYAHIAYRVGTGSADTTWYRRCNLSSAAWSSGLQMSGTDANGGSIGSRWQGIDLGVVRNSNGTYAIIIAAAFNEAGNTRYGVHAHVVSIDSSGNIYNNDGAITNNRIWNVAGTPPGRSGVAVEIEHTGDGFTSSTPHAWITWGRTTIYQVKCAWQGSSVGWSGPTNLTTIQTGVTAQDYANGRWDGSHWMMACASPLDTTTVRILQRNQANTSTTVFDSPVHPQGVVTKIGLSYDATTKDLRVYAVGTASNVLYFVDYTRASSSWNSWATVSATAVLTTGNEFATRRGGSSGNARLDVITAHSGSPNTIVHTAQTTSSTPNNAIWNTSGQAYFNGGAADVAATLTLDWDFSDPDPGQGQGSYALSRQIGAGTVNYWNAGTTTWGVSEVQNSTATTAVTLASAWASAADLPYTFKVKVWDSVNTPAAGYSSALVIIPSAKVNPTMTAPTAAQVLNTDQVTAAWTVSEQTSRRVRLSTNPGGQVVYDSGFVTDSTPSFTVPNRLTNGTGWTVEVTTKNLEGLASTAQTRNFTVVYSNPPAPISTLVPVPASGWVQVTNSALTPVGAQPSISLLDLYRRPSATPVLNSNPDMAGNVTGWSVTSGTGTLSYSTTQFHSTPGAARFVPSTGATPTVESPSQVINPLNLYHGSAWIRPDTANKPIFVQVSWYTSGSSLISSVSTVLSAPVALAWQYLEIVADPSLVPTAARASVSVGETSTPTATDAWYADDIQLQVYDATTGTRVATAKGLGAVVTDWGVPSGIDQEYQWIATGSNGTTVSGPWVA